MQSANTMIFEKWIQLIDQPIISFTKVVFKVIKKLQDALVTKFLIDENKQYFLQLF